jgi:hypothetical protein
MPSENNKKGRFPRFSRDRPRYSALSGATENIPYAELGIKGIFTHPFGMKAWLHRT